MLEDSSLMNTTANPRVAEFTVGRASTTDGPCVGCPIEVTTPDKIEKSTKSFWQIIE